MLVKGIKLSANTFVVRPSFSTYGSEVREVNKNSGSISVDFVFWGVRLGHDITKELLVIRGLVYTLQGRRDKLKWL